MSDPIVDSADFREFLDHFSEDTRSGFISQYAMTPRPDLDWLEEFDPILSRQQGEDAGLLRPAEAKSPLSWDQKIKWGAASAAALENIGGRILYGLDKHVGSGLVSPVRGDARFVNAEGELTSEFDADEWFGSAWQDLRRTNSGRRVLSNYLKGDYDRIGSFSDFVRVAGYDFGQGELETLNAQATGPLGFASKLVGSFADPVGFGVGSLAVRGTAKVGQGLLKGKAALQAGTQLRKFRALGIATAAGEALPFNLAYESVLQAMDDERTAEDFYRNFFANYVADIGLTLVARGAYRLGSRHLAGRREKLREQIGEHASKRLDEIDEALGEAVEAEVAERSAMQQLGLFDQLDSTGRTVEVGIDPVPMADLTPSQAVAELQSALEGNLFDLNRAEGALSVAKAGGDQNAIAAAEQRVQQLREARSAMEGRFTEEVNRLRSPEPLVDPEGQLRLFGDDLGAGIGESLTAQLSRLPESQRHELGSLLSDEDRSLLSAIVDRLSHGEQVEADVLNERVAKALEAINQRSPFLSFNPASLSPSRAVPTVKLDQVIEHAEIVGFVPTTPLEDILMALKSLGLGSEDVRKPADRGSYMGGAGFRSGIPPTMKAQFEGSSVVDPKDMYPDRTRDAWVKRINAVSESATGRANNVGRGIIESLNGLASRIRYASSENPVVASTAAHMWESSYPPKAKARSQWNASAPSERLEQMLHLRGMAHSYILKKAAERLMKRSTHPMLTLLNSKVTITPMESSEFYRDFMDVVERLRTVNAVRVRRLVEGRPREPATRFGDIPFLHIVGPEGGGVSLREQRVVETATDQFIDRFFGHLDDSGKAGVKGELLFVQQALIRSDMIAGVRPTTGSMAAARMALDAPMLRISNALRDNGTALVISDRIGLADFREMLRIIQDLDATATTDDVFRIFSRMTEGGQERRIGLDEIKAAFEEADPVRREVIQGQMVRRLVNLYNARLLGLTPVDKALAVAERFPEFTRFDAHARVWTQTDVTVRYAQAQNLKELMLVWQSIHGQQTFGNRYRSNLFSERLFDLERIERVALDPTTAQQSRSFADSIERWVIEGSRALRAFAIEHVEAVTDAKGKALPAKKRVALHRETDAFFNALDDSLGIAGKPGEEGFIRRAGEETLLMARNTMLGRWGLPMAFDASMGLARSMTGPVKADLVDTMRGMFASLKRSKMEPGDYGYIESLITMAMDDGAVGLVRRMDNTFLQSDFDAATVAANGQRTMGETAADRFSGINRRVVPKLIADFSGFTAVNSAAKNGLHIGTLGMFFDEDGLLDRLVAVQRDLDKGIGFDEAIKAHGFETHAFDITGKKGNYHHYAFLRNYLSGKHLRELGKLRAAGNMRTVELPRLLGLDKRFGGHKVSVLEPPPGATPEQLEALGAVAAAIEGWVEKGLMLTPGRFDEIRSLNRNGLASRFLAQFFKAATGASNRLFAQTGNAPLSQQWGVMVYAVSMAMGVQMLRAYAKGQEDRWLEEWEDPKQAAANVAEAIAFTGLSSAVGEKVVNGLIGALLGTDSGFRGKRQIDYATGFPVQSFAQQALKETLVNVPNALARDGWEGLGAGSRRWLRRMVTWGVGDTLLFNALSGATERLGIDEATGVEDYFEWWFPEHEED